MCNNYLTEAVVYRRTLCGYTSFLDVIHVVLSYNKYISLPGEMFTIDLIATSLNRDINELAASVSLKTTCAKRPSFSDNTGFS